MSLAVATAIELLEELRDQTWSRMVNEPGSDGYRYQKHEALQQAIALMRRPPSVWWPIATLSVERRQGRVTCGNETPKVLLRFKDGAVSVAYWDAYYAEGGDGYEDRKGPWIEPVSGERLTDEYGPPTHWMEIPA